MTLNRGTPKTGRCERCWWKRFGAADLFRMPVAVQPSAAPTATA